MASNADKFKKLARKWTGQIGAGGVADDSVTTIPLASTTNLPTTTGVVAVIDRVDSNGVATSSLEETVVGVVSGDNLVTCTRGAEGTAQAHSAGAVVEILFTNKGWGDLVDGLLVQHDQAGLHTNVTACNVTASGTTALRQVTASNITASQITTNVVAERTAASGVTIDGLLIKDSHIGAWDGWMPASESWTYASATTITIPAGGAAKYVVGDKIKLTQTTVKYFSVITVADELLTITGGTSYTLVDAAITLNYYSHAASPIGFPQWFTWAPSYGASGSMTYTSVTTNVAKFAIIGRVVHVEFGARGTTGGTANTDITITPPVLPLSQSFYIGGAALCYDGATKSGGWHSQDNVISIYKYDRSNWGLGATKDVKVNFFYRI